MDSAFEKQVERFDIGVKIVTELFPTHKYALDAFLSALQPQNSPLLEQYFKQEMLERASIRTKLFAFQCFAIHFRCCFVDCRF